MAQTSRQPLRELVEENREAIKALAHRHRGLSISLFGSVALGNDDDSSDIDFLVEFEPGSSLFDLLHLKDDLEDLLGCTVDVVSAGGLKSRDDRIRRAAVPL
jgi:predicted nucleotidyltransferase